MRSGAGPWLGAAGTFELSGGNVITMHATYRDESCVTINRRAFFAHDETSPPPEPCRPTRTGGETAARPALPAFVRSFSALRDRETAYQLTCPLRADSAGQRP